MIGAQLGSLGLPMGVVYFVNKMKYDPSIVVSTTLNFCNLISIISSAVLSLIYFFNPGYFGTLDSLTYLICTGYIIFANARQVLHFYNISKIDAKKILLIDILPVVFSFIPLTICFLLQFKFSINLVLFFDLLIVPVFGFIIVYLITRNGLKLEYKIDISYLKKALPFGLLINCADLLALVNAGVALMLLRYFESDFILLGYYSRSIRLATIINVAFASFLRLLYSHWSSIEGEERRRSVENVLNIFLLSAIGVCVLIYIFTEELISLLFGSAYLPATDITRIILIGTFGNLISQILQRLFISDGSTHLNIIYLLCGFITNAIFCFILIPMFPTLGAAYGQVTGYLIMGMVALGLAKVKYGLRLRRIITPSKYTIYKVLNSLKK